MVDDLCKLLKKGGFRLTRWISNNLDVASSIPETERAQSMVNLDLDDLPIERILGVLWNVSSDSFEFKVNVKEKPTTRRGILSLCRRGMDWDEQVNNKDLQRWKEWLDDLSKLSGTTIPRCIKPDWLLNVESVQLHHFCDASERGYAVVSYLRLVDANGKVHCAFIMGKVPPMSTEGDIDPTPRTNSSGSCSRSG